MVAFFFMEPYETDIALFPVFPQSIVAGGIQRVNFIPLLIAAGSALVSGAGALASGAVSAGAGALGAVATGTTSLVGTAIGAGGSVLGGIGSLAGNIFQTGAGVVSGAGQALFGGGPATPGLTVGQSMAAMAEPGYYGVTEAGGLFSNLSLDTLGNVASLGYGIYQSAEQKKLAEKMIEAQRGAGYVVGAPSAPGATTLAPTTSIAIPAAAAAVKELDTKVMIKYAIYAVIAYLLFKGFK